MDTGDQPPKAASGRKVTRIQSKKHQQSEFPSDCDSSDESCHPNSSLFTHTTLSKQIRRVVKTLRRPGKGAPEKTPDHGKRRALHCARHYHETCKIMSGTMKPGRARQTASPTGSSRLELKVRWLKRTTGIDLVANAHASTRCH